MNIVFMGTPEFAVTCLDALHKAGHEIQAVFTRADTPKNRGMKMLPPPVKLRGMELGLPVHQPTSLKKGDSEKILQDLAPDAIVVAAYGRMLPQSILDMPKYGCLNVHASLLPRFRGASPINAAILAGDRETGITIMQMDAGLDTGDMLLKCSTPIGESETFGSLHDRLARMGGELIVKALAQLRSDGLKAEKQPTEGTYAHLIRTEDCRADFSRTAFEAACRIRAFDPAPAAFSSIDGTKVKLFDAKVLEEHGENEPGVIESFDKKGAVISCGVGKIIVGMVQPAGGKKMPGDAFFRGRPQYIGKKLG